MWRNVLLVLVMCSVLSAQVRAAGPCFIWTADGSGLAGTLADNFSGSGMCSEEVAREEGITHPAGVSYSSGGASQETAHSASDTTTCTIVHTAGTGGFPGAGSSTVGFHAKLAGSCPVTACSVRAGKTYDTVVTDSAPVATGTTVHGADGCEYTVSSSPTNVIGRCPGGMCAIQSMTATGDTTPSGAPPGPSSTPGDCFNSSDGGTTCSEAAPQSGDGGGKNCGTFNGDEVCVASIPPGTCQSFASGGVACSAAVGSSAIVTPPGPNSGTAGVAASPDGQVQAGAPGAVTTTNYYSHTTITGSTTPVVTSSGGANVGNGTGASGGGSGSGSGSGPSAANGDCGASGVNCGADGVLPTLSDVPTIAQSSTTYSSALGSVPIVAAVGALSGSVPAGVCPTATFAVFGHSYVIDAQCALFANVASVVALCMLAFWTFLGVRIVMSA